MISPAMRGLTALTCAAALLALAACGDRPGRTEFVAACMKGHGATTSSCECAAGEAASRLPSEVHRAMVLDMAGDEHAARAIVQGLSERDQMAFIEAVGGIFKTCFVDQQEPG